MRTCSPAWRHIDLLCRPTDWLQTRSELGRIVREPQTVVHAMWTLPLFAFATAVCSSVHVVWCKRGLSCRREHGRRSLPRSEHHQWAHTRAKRRHGCDYRFCGHKPPLRRCQTRSKVSERSEQKLEYDTIRDFKVRSKADISQLNLPHGTKH